MAERAVGATREAGPPAAASARLAELDALRGLAALAVVAFHYTSQYDAEYGHAAGFTARFDAGRYGVQLFFLISGFVILLTLSRTRRARDFVLARASRLYPVYWAAMLLTAAVLVRFPLPGHAVTPAMLAANATMVATWLRQPYVDGVYWTLAVELLFYAIMLGLFAAGLLARLRAVALAWLAVEAAIAVADARGLAVGPLHALALGGQAHLFVAGMLFHRLRSGDRAPAVHVLIAASLGLHWLLAATVGGALCATASYAVFYAFAYGRLGWLAARPLTALGAVSYSLYLVHQNLGYVLIRAGYARGWAPWLSIALATAAALLAAWLLTALVERPALAAIRGRARRPAAAVVPVAAPA